MTLKEEILDLLDRRPGFSDREITNELRGTGAPQQPIFQACKDLERRGRLERKKRSDGRIGNYLAETAIEPDEPLIKESTDILTEDALKKSLQSWLSTDGWTTKIAWARERGSDVVATKQDAAPWVIEVKGCGSRPQMQGNYFLAILGQILQRMQDPSAKYSIALPDLPRFRGLWERLPDAAKARAGVSALFVGADGSVAESTHQATLRLEEDTLSLEEIASRAGAVRRRLFRLLDWIDGEHRDREKTGERIARLLAQHKVPRLTANNMHFVLGFRNATEYEPNHPSLLDIAAWRTAWDAILEWGKAKGWKE